jgi:hypothetical protein
MGQTVFCKITIGVSQVTLEVNSLTINDFHKIINSLVN